MAIFRDEPSRAEKGDRSAGDRARHRQKVRESIREGVADVIADEAIIGKSGDKIVKVPIKGIKEYRFVYGDNASDVAQGNGKAERGQVVGKADGEAEGEPDKAGDEEGQDYYETEITLDELIEILFEELELPELERKKLRHIETLQLKKRKGYRKVGVRVRLDARETAKRRIKRKSAVLRGVQVKEADIAKKIWEGKPEEAQEDAEQMPVAYQRADNLKTGRERFPFRREDLTYRHRTVDIKRESNAVVICIMDTSGSMDTVKKFFARTFFFLLHRFISTKYQKVEVVFVAHHTTAREVTEEEFFYKGESGGTFISSGYLKALEIIQERYHPSLWNIYAFHCSDGDNFDSDTPTAIKAMTELSDVCNLMGYGEIKPKGSRYYESSMINVFDRIAADNFESVLIEAKEDIWRCFKSFLAKDRARIAEEVE